MFLVFPDAALYISQIDYQINGILGFPVIAALGEVQLSRKDEFVVPLQHSTPARYNMALDFLTPVIEIAGDSYTFDTGATTTMLYLPYFQRHKRTIEGKYQEKALSFGGAGGSVTKKGYEVDFEAPIGNQVIRLNDIMLFSKQIKENGDHYYGNIGQDLIGKFLLSLQLLNLNPQCSHGQRYKRADPVENGVNEIIHRWNTEHARIVSAAGIPRHENGRDRSAVFQCPAEVNRVEPFVCKGFGVHLSGNNQREVLV